LNILMPAAPPLRRRQPTGKLGKPELASSFPLLADGTGRSCLRGYQQSGWRARVMQGLVVDAASLYWTNFDFPGFVMKGMPK
jgi:hypothetical protein